METMTVTQQVDQEFYVLATGNVQCHFHNVPLLETVLFITVFTTVNHCTQSNESGHYLNHLLISSSITLLSNLHLDDFGGLVASMLASGTQVCGFKPGRSRWIFRA
jgi:hypothetical protein